MTCTDDDECKFGSRHFLTHFCDHYFQGILIIIRFSCSHSGQAPSFIIIIYNTNTWSEEEEETKMNDKNMRRRLRITWTMHHMCSSSGKEDEIHDLKA